jgi:hypothetical protein
MAWLTGRARGSLPLAVPKVNRDSLGNVITLEQQKEREEHRRMLVHRRSLGAAGQNGSFGGSQEWEKRLKRLSTSNSSATLKAGSRESLLFF